MNKTNLNEKSKMDFMVIGFAIFSMLFGAGNLIFPPFLGFMTGSAWIVGFIGYVLADIILGVSGIMTSLDHDYEKDGAVSISSRVDKRIGLLLGLTMITCIGPAVVIPRTAATTFEISILPLLPNFNPLVFSIIFFLIVIALTITKSKVVDVIGKVLTPILLVSLAILIIKGIATPIGDMSQVPQIENNVFAEGIAQGYQTMDALGIGGVTALIMTSFVAKGYKDKKENISMTLKSATVAGIGLVIIYGGLAYLGSTVSTIYDASISQTTLLVNITNSLLGKSGIMLLGIIVAFACLTTAIGLTSITAKYFEDVSNKKLKYSHLVSFICIFSAIASNLGVDKIIAIAVPILTVIYPVSILLIVMSIFSKHLKSQSIFKGAAFATLFISLLNVANSLGVNIVFLNKLPLASLGFNWVIPAIIGGILGKVLIKNNKKDKSSSEKISA